MPNVPSRSDDQDVTWPYDYTLDHNAGSCSRSATIIRVEPLPECRADAGDAYAPPVLAGNYAMKTLVDIGLAPEATLQRLGYRHYERLAKQRQSEA